MTESDGERLQKVLARAGFGSRRVCELLIDGGRVEINGEIAVLGRRVEVCSDLVVVDGTPVSVLPGLVYYLLNKPPGVVTTSSDPEGRPTVIELVPAEPRVFPVGRLDVATEGLIVLTNDGALAQRLTHPSHGVDKEYLVEVAGDPSQAALRRLRCGVLLDDGVTTAPARVTRLGPGCCRIVIHEGRNRQIRKMCESVGHPVLRLVRVRIGPVSDGRLRPGAWRALTTRELRSLSTAARSRGSATHRLARGA